ncbi:MAG: hypothetical protein M1828_005290 [Chrysothrix sp. TS-e1954]|nr:MAG: hypothetical protein M1828_005290 [Chrysothrix sp. TS-e1954]
MSASPPISPGRPGASPSGRRSRAFSFRSDRSSESKGSKPKVTDLHEETRDKKRFTAASKANPNRAIAEAQPADRTLDPNTLSNIRNVQWKDTEGNVITDPDISNPTRHRLERPLDTIRSFEAAIDSGYKRRNPPGRNETADAVTSYSSRRSSFVGGPDYKSRSYNGYNGAPSSYRNSSYRQDYYPPGNAPMRPNPYRQSTAPQMTSPAYNDQGVYPGPSYRESYDTVNTGGSSGSPSEPWGNSTDPSSENSSFDRIQYANGRADYNDAYGSPHGMPMREAIQEEYGYDGHDYPVSQQFQPPVRAAYQNGPVGNIPNGMSMAPPPPPKHLAQQQRQPPTNQIPLGRQPTSGSGPGPAPPGGGSRLSKQPRGAPLQREQSGGKRKSWLKRTFSKA